MGNLVLHSAEEPDNLRATTGTVEVPTKRDNAAALVLGARPIIQHQPAARHTTNVYAVFLFSRSHFLTTVDSRVRYTLAKMVFSLFQHASAVISLRHLQC